MTAYFIAPKSADPSGGIWFIHRLAGMLPDASVSQEEPFEVFWDAHPEKQGHRLDMNKCPAPTGADTTIIPEVRWGNYQGLPGRKILFVQNRMWLDKRLDLADVEAWACSRYLCNYLKRVHGISSKKVTPFVDHDVWHTVPKRDRQVLVMARRNPYYEDMLERLRQADWPFVAVHHPVSQRELAGHLAQSDYYVHLTHPEGFPELCLEAMRSRTVVVGTTGGGGCELMFHMQTAYVVQDPQSGHYGKGEAGNGVEFIDRILAALNFLQGDLARKEKIRAQGYHWSLGYTEERTRKELLEALGEAQGDADEPRDGQV
jgi:hypothetical protein